MATKLGEVKSYIFKSIGASDAIADATATKNVNEAIKLITRLLEPNECISIETFNYPGGSSHISISTSIAQVYDAFKDSYGTGTKLLEIPRNILETFSAGVTKSVYCVDKWKLYVRPIPSTAISIYSKCLKYPNDVTDDNQDLPISQYDSLVISIATALTWSVFEEPDSSRLWQEISAFLAQLSVPREKLEQAARELSPIQPARRTR